MLLTPCLCLYVADLLDEQGKSCAVSMYVLAEDEGLALFALVLDAVDCVDHALIVDQAHRSFEVQCC